MTIWTNVLPFCWQDVQLYFGELCPSQEQGMEPRFYLSVEWKEGKHCGLDEIILLNTSSQPRALALGADSTTPIKRIAEVLSWDNLVHYNFRCSYATKLHTLVPMAHCNLLMGHRCASTRRLKTVLCCSACAN